MPMAGYLVDYLVAEAYYRSKGEIHFPSRYTETGAFFCNQTYGAGGGRFYHEENVRLFLPKELLKTSNNQINYIAAYNEESLCLTLMNASSDKISSEINLNQTLVNFTDATSAIIFDNNPEDVNSLTCSNGSFVVDIPPKDEVNIIIKGANIQTVLQQKYYAEDKVEIAEYSKSWKTSLGNIHAYIISFSDELTSAYIYTDAYTDKIIQTTLEYSIDGKSSSLTDNKYGFEFSIPLNPKSKQLKFRVKGMTPKESIITTEYMSIEIAE